MPISHLLNETVTLYPFAGYAGAGERTFGAGVVERARIEWMDKQLKRNTEQAIRLVARVFLRPSASVAANDRLVYDSVNYQVQDVTRPRDVGARPDHIELLISEEIS